MLSWIYRQERRLRRVRTERPRLEGLESRQVLSTFTVTNVNDSGAGSFRQAILDANSAPAGTNNTIAFNITGAGVQTIATTSALPNVAQNVTIDGFTQAGSKANTLASGGLNSVLLISTAGFTVQSGTVVVRGLDFPNGGLVLQGGTTSVQGCYLGTNALGTVAPSLAPGSSAQTGLTILSNSNLIGGTNPVARNLISGNNSVGLMIQGGASGNVVEGNLIGTTATGTAALGNAIGVRFDSSPNNRLGDVASGGQNVISGNSYAGVWLFNASNSVVESNLIGTTATGQGPLGNTNFGIAIDGSTAAAVIGGTTTTARNIISGNVGSGILVATTGANNTILGNVIGVSADGTTPVSNLGGGIKVARADSGLMIGGSSAIAGNVIADNIGNGVVISAATTGSSAPTGVTIRSNRIYNNSGIGIDLGGDGISNNHPGGLINGTPNGMLNKPLENIVTSNGTSTTITGTYSGAPNSTYTLQFFSSPFSSYTSHGDGLNYLGDTTITTDASGSASYTATVPAAVAAGIPVSAIAIDAAGNTSEFSNIVAFTFNTPVNLGVVISSPTVAVSTGHSFTYTVTVTNAGPNTADNVSLVCSALGAGVQVDATQTTITQGAISVEVGGIYGSIGTLASGASAKATITVKPTTGGQVSLTGLTYSSQAETTTADNGTQQLVTVQATPDLLVQAAVATSTPVNQAATFTFTVSNVGPGDATGAKLTVPIPAGATYSNGSTSQGSIGQSGSAVLVDIGTIASNGVVTVHVPITSSTPGILTLSGTATLNETDPTPANNAASASVTVLSAPDLQTAVTVPAATVFLGDIITYVVTVANVGQTVAHSSVALAALSPAGQFISSTSSQGSTSSQSGTVQAVLGDIAPGEKVDITIQVRSVTAGIATLTATSNSAAAGDSNTANNTTAASVSVIPRPTPVEILNITPQVSGGKVRGFDIDFSAPLDPGSASNIHAYRVVSPGKDGTVGNPNDHLIGLSYARYDAGLRRVSLGLKQAVPLNTFLGIVAYGFGPNAIVDTLGQPIDGGNRGTPGTDLVALVGRGNKLTYVDADGDRVLLQIQGSGGLVMWRRLGDTPIATTVGTSPGLSTLIGGVKRSGSGGNGMTYIKNFLGLDTVRNHLPSNKFIIG